MAPSNSPQKLSTSRRTEAPRLRATKPPKKYRSIADIRARAAWAVIDDDGNITCDRASVPEMVGQNADIPPALIGGSDGRLREDYEEIPDDTPALDDGSDDDKYSNVTCERCGLGDREDDLLLCDKCDRGCHVDCIRPVVTRIPFGSWFCSDCAVRPHPEHFSNKEMENFFRIQRSKKVERTCNTSSSAALHESRRRRRGSSRWSRKTSDGWLPCVPSEEHERRFLQMQSLAVALSSHGIDFSNELTYRRRMAPKSANSAQLDIVKMQVISKRNTETVERCIVMMKNGEFPPLLVVHDPWIGYTVQADDYIKNMTFLGEYTGDVDYIQNREQDDCDSLMTLLLAHDFPKSLLIVLCKRGNIARFVSGINNHNPDEKKKQNVKCVRYKVNGESRVFVISTRDIVKGERLYYVYNGFEKEYPGHQTFPLIHA